MADFDPEDKDCWYIGMMSREEANAILQAERDSGVFLVRDSTTIKGDFVLCVKEDNKVSHYIINKTNSNGAMKFRIGEQEFPSLPALLNFYKTHYLDTTSLIRPARRLKYIAKYRFPGKDPDDLPFEKGDILLLVRKDEEQWWTAMNSEGRKGLVPVPYIEKYERDEDSGYPANQESRTQTTTVSSIRMPPAKPSENRPLPAWARVIKQRNPNAYDKTQLQLVVGEDVLVTSMNENGQWDGELKSGKRGNFPFTHVKFLDELDD